MADEQAGIGDDVGDKPAERDIDAVIASVVAKGREGSDAIEKEEPPPSEEQETEAAPEKQDAPKADAKPAKAKAEPKDEVPADARLRAIKAGLSGGKLEEVAKALDMGEEELADLLKVDKKAFAALRVQHRNKEQAFETREQAIAQAEQRVRSYLTAAEEHIKAREAYESGDFDAALKLAFGVEGANDFYKAHRSKVAGHDPRVTKLEKQLREEQATREKASREAEQARLTQQEQEQVAAYIDSTIKAQLLEVEHTGVANAAKHPRFCREVYDVLDERHRRAPFSDELSFAAALDEVSASVYAKNGWKEFIESLSAPTGGSTRGAPDARKSERKGRNIAARTSTQDPEIGPPENETKEEKLERWKRKLEESISHDQVSDRTIGLG